ncbi:hypothetical protein CVT27_32720 [Streptomyces cavourensis]|nr:hypothetical protein CVT27_32720 [Streptomyces cavourensis]
MVDAGMGVSMAFSSGDGRSKSESLFPEPLRPDDFRPHGEGEGRGETILTFRSRTAVPRGSGGPSGPRGPRGPRDPDGPEGPDGPVGPDGWAPDGPCPRRWCG